MISYLLQETSASIRDELLFIAVFCAIYTVS